MRKTFTALSFLCIVSLPVGFILLSKPISTTIHEPQKTYFDKISDSMDYYYDKRHCYFRCDKLDSAYEAEKKYWVYRDSVISYAKVLFDFTTPNNEEKINCECK